MKKIFFLAVALCSLNNAIAQLTMPENGGSTRGWVGERIGLTDVSIDYGRPAVRGREGKVWGNLVHEGFIDDATFGQPRKIPWRAGANKNTTISFSTDVHIEGKKLSAGKYGFFVAYGKEECTLIFSANTEAWGSYFYNEKDDVLRVKVKPAMLKENVERLSYSFSDQDDSSATVNLNWEKLNIPFRISTSLLQLQLASIQKELNSTKIFNSDVWLEAADYMLSNNIHLDEALLYAERAIRSNPSFSAYATKAEILEKTGKNEEAKNALATAIKNANSPTQVHFYARRMQAQQMHQKAFDIFQQNYKHFPNTYTTSVGMARGYSGIGNKKEALKYAQKALPLAATDVDKNNVQAMIQKLKEGKEIN